MGAGFALAMRDLELRGAGNILGTQQSGHIAMVGYEMYCALLERAVRQFKKMAPRESVDVNIAVPTSSAQAETLYRQGNRVRIAGQLDCRMERQDFGPGENRSPKERGAS